MDTTLQTMETFIAGHHVMTLATSRDNIPQVCNLFYAYLPEALLFVVASDAATEHMTNAAENPQVAASIVLETKQVGKIEGIQIKGEMRRATKAEGRAYFRAFPYAKVMNPTLWVIEPRHMKLTDNRLGFGKKLIWTRSVSE
jgi:uncharacterized protein YhbP (UPF0306 family)